MALFGRGAKVLMVALFVSVCVLLHLVFRVTTLMSEADDARLLAGAAMWERDRMKLQTRNHEREVLKVIDSEVPRREPEDNEYDTLRTTRTATVAPSGHEETQIMSEKFKYHFKVRPECDSHCLKRALWRAFHPYKGCFGRCMLTVGAYVAANVSSFYMY